MICGGHSHSHHHTILWQSPHSVIAAFSQLHTVTIDLLSIVLIWPLPDLPGFISFFFPLIVNRTSCKDILTVKVYNVLNNVCLCFPSSLPPSPSPSFFLPSFHVHPCLPVRLHVSVGMHVPQHACAGKRPWCRSLLSPSIICVLETEVRSSGLLAGTFT